MAPYPPRAGNPRARGAAHHKRESGRLSRSTALRRDIIACAKQFAESHGLRWYASLGTAPTLFFEASGGTHGNFHPASYAAILGQPAWKNRLDRRPQRPDALPREKRASARALDAADSADALLMNVFCHPGVGGLSPLAQLFGERELPPPEFGVPAIVPRWAGSADTAEIAMQIGGCLVEATLTETGFPPKVAKQLEAYRDFTAVFDASALRRHEGKYRDAQFLRLILAARAHDKACCVIWDARRPDLLPAWWCVVGAIRPLALRRRCRFLLWQEIAAAVPEDLRAFLREKYGIA